MDDKFSTKPLYEQVKDVLAENVVTGAWKPGTAIPNEIDLAREYGVSVGTMRKALADLEAARLVTRRQGRGTFVVQQTELDFQKRYEKIFETSGARSNARVTVSAVDKLESEGRITELLQLKNGDAVFRCRQLRQIGDRKMMFEEAYVPACIFPSLSDDQPYDLYATAKRAGVFLGSGRERVSIQPTTRAVEDALGVPPSTQMVVLERLILRLDGRPVEARTRWTDLKDHFYFSVMD